MHEPPGICGQLTPPLWILPPRRALPFSVPGLYHALSGHFCAGLAAFFPTSPHALPLAPVQGGLSPLPPGRARGFSHMLWLEKEKLLSYSSHTRKHLHSARHRAWRQAAGSSRERRAWPLSHRRVAAKAACTSGAALATGGGHQQARQHKPVPRHRRVARRPDGN